MDQNEARKKLIEESMVDIAGMKMARELRKQEVADAVKEYMVLHPEKELSTNEKGFTIMPGDILVSCEEGKLVCNNPEVQATLCGILSDMPQEPARSPRTEARQERTNVPATPRNGQTRQMAPARNGLDALTTADIISYINPKATEAEAYLFAEFCRRKGADPMTKQCYLVIYENEKGRQVSFIAGKEYFTEKAEAHPQFNGFEAGIIVRKKEGGELEHRSGTFWIPKEEELLGGYAKVHRKDRAISASIDVPLSDYNTGKNQWGKMPATMIRKVAIVQALRESFPAALGGMYDRSEMDQAIDAEYEVRA